MRPLLLGISCLALIASTTSGGSGARSAEPNEARPLLDQNNGGDWPAYGQSYGEQHFSAASQINAANVESLGLVWSYDLPAGNPMSGPLAVGGVLYTATGYSVVRAFNAATGKLLWEYDPNSLAVAGKKMRASWGGRGLAWWKGTLFVGTVDGRLIALNSKNGKVLWTAMTVDADDFRFITGAPRVFDGKVIIGHGGADTANTRGYVTAYDTETGRQLWRFFTVPGDPAKGFEDKAQAMAAKTWTGEWWKLGGGGTVWNTFTYDPDTNTVFLGTGNGAPWNQRVRSPGGGDNLFLCSIVALDASTGKYKWHYQFNPGETWDYNASMDMQLADLMIDGQLRKVVIEAPKNGFVYVIDRVSGKLISADAIARVTWATGIDLKTGRPMEHPDARYPNGTNFQLFPNFNGAHTWLPSAFSPQTKLVYLPVTELGTAYNDVGISPAWRRSGEGSIETGVNLSEVRGSKGHSALLAWDPAKRKEAWRVPSAGAWSGGVLATGGRLVFQGQAAGSFVAYDASSGKSLWKFDAQAPVLAPPISYKVAGRQYVTVMSGIGTSAGVGHDPAIGPIDYRTQARRILTFALGGKRVLPKAEPYKLAAAPDPDFRRDEASANRGANLYSKCLVCHGPSVASGGTAPDLRASAIPTSFEAFDAIVRQGAAVQLGMPRFQEFDDGELADLRQYIRTQAAELRK